MRALEFIAGSVSPLVSMSRLVAVGYTDDANLCFLKVAVPLDSQISESSHLVKACSYNGNSSEHF